MTGKAGTTAWFAAKFFLPDFPDLPDIPVLPD